MSKSQQFLTPVLTRSQQIKKMNQLANIIEYSSQYDEISAFGQDTEINTEDTFYNFSESETVNFERGIKNRISKKIKKVNQLNTFKRLRQKILPQKNNFAKQQEFLDFNIMRFQNQLRTKTYRVLCFQEDDLNIPQKYQEMKIEHKSDDDKQSDKEDVQNAINYVHKSLIECVEIEKKYLIKNQKSRK